MFKLNKDSEVEYMIVKKVNNDSIMRTYEAGAYPCFRILARLVSGIAYPRL